MAIWFKKVERENPQDRTAPKKWYISLKSISILRSKEMGRRAAEGTTLDPKEAEMSFARYGKVLVEALMDSHSVEIEDVGIFRLTSSSNGAETKDEATAGNVKNINVRFTPYKATRDRLNGAHLRDVETIK